MTRKMARIVSIDAIRPNANAETLETAIVGGWTVVTRKGEFQSGDRAVYFEIDSYLPEGNPAWQFLVDKQPCEFEGRIGHVLRTLKLRGQVSQGLLLGLSVLEGKVPDVEALRLGEDVAEVLGVFKYDPPIPECLLGKIRGYFPAAIHKTDQERIQNLSLELDAWRKEGTALAWEVTEKLEGYSCTFAWLKEELHVCSRTIDWLEIEGDIYWKMARRLEIEDKMRMHFGTRNIAIQGELVGPGVEGNIYRLNDHRFYLYDVYDADQHRYFTPDEREAVATLFHIDHVPVVSKSFVIDDSVTMESLLLISDGESLLRPGQAREGLVYKARAKEISFKVVSNKYLLKQTR